MKFFLVLLVTIGFTAVSANNLLRKLLGHRHHSEGSNDVWGQINNHPGHWGNPKSSSTPSSTNSPAPVSTTTTSTTTEAPTEAPTEASTKAPTNPPSYVPPTDAPQNPPPADLNALSQDVIDKVLKQISIEVFINLFNIFISNCNIHFIGSVIQSVITVLFNAIQVPTVLQSFGGYLVIVELSIKGYQSVLVLVGNLIESLDYGLPRAALEIVYFLLTVGLKALVAVVGPPEHLRSEIQQILRILVKFDLELLQQNYAQVDHFCQKIYSLCPVIDYSHCHFPVYNSN